MLKIYLAPASISFLTQFILTLAITLFLLRRLRRRRERPIEHNGISVFFTTSVGGAMLIAESRSLDELITQADQAMYWAKAAGRDCAAICNQDSWAVSGV